MKKVLFVVLIMMLLLAMAIPAFAGPAPKVDVCHKPGTPAESSITISENALPAHLAHGDTEGACGGVPITACPISIDPLVVPAYSSVEFNFDISTPDNITWYLDTNNVPGRHPTIETTVDGINTYFAFLGSRAEPLPVVYVNTDSFDVQITFGLFCGEFIP